ncbi:unnamed protein product [Symbiodinium sp. KB8]|nr:unnamed protein product [Symbiodinium sp. KB8]
MAMSASAALALSASLIHTNCPIVSLPFMGLVFGADVHGTVGKYEVKDIHNFEFSVEFLLGIPVPHHQFEQPPILVEVSNRNADIDMSH